jgi:hypothetical protein
VWEITPSFAKDSYVGIWEHSACRSYLPSHQNGKAATSGYWRGLDPSRRARDLENVLYVTLWQGRTLIAASSFLLSPLAIFLLTPSTWTLSDTHPLITQSAIDSGSPRMTIGLISYCFAIMPAQIKDSSQIFLNLHQTMTDLERAVERAERVRGIKA